VLVLSGGNFESWAFWPGHGCRVDGRGQDYFWFGNDAGFGDSDKMGHAFTSYALTHVLANRRGTRMSLARTRCIECSYQHAGTHYLLTYSLVFQTKNSDRLS
jgi:hypothetical protein